MGKLDFLQNEINRLKDAGLFNTIKTIESPQGAWIKIDNKKVLNMCSNNYLGLANHPKLIEYTKEILDEYGVGPGAVRSIAGTMSLHNELEKVLTEFKQVEKTLAVQSCFLANQAVIPSLGVDTIITDELNHASIIDGVRLTKAQRVIYQHNDMNDLAAKLNKLKGIEKKLIVTDSVFSMDGDIAKIDEIAKLAKESDSIFMIDDAHGEGVLGNHGRGAVNHFGLSHHDVDIDIGSMSKAIGVVGGYIAGTEILIEFLKQKARPFLFSSALTIPDIAAAIASIKIILKDDTLVKRLWENGKYFQKLLNDIGFDTGKTETPITPIMIGDEKKSKEFSKLLFENNIFAMALGFPTVPRGKARIRVMLSAAHSKDDLDFALNKLEEVGKKLNII